MRFKTIIRAFLVGFFALSLFFLPSNVLAANYGEGTYGSGNYGEGEVTPTVTPTTAPATQGSGSAPQACTDTVPETIAPWIYSASSSNSNSILLKFTDWSTSKDRFVLEYGTMPGEYKYAASGISKDATSFLVEKLSPNTTYYFRIRAGNGCANGLWSNEISASTKSNIVLNQIEITETTLEPVVDVEDKEDSCQTYRVKFGDTLWGIANDLLGDGSKYQTIIDENSDRYKTLKTSSDLSVGWELKVNCGGTKITSEEEKDKAGRYGVNVKVVNKKQQPVKGAKVTLHSDPKEARTDENGMAKFTDVEPGEHRVLIAYNNFKGEQTINLTGDVKEFNLNITVEEKRVMISPVAGVIIGLLSFLVIILLVMIFRKKRLP